MSELDFGEFRRDFRQDVLSQGDSDGQFHEAVFCELVTERLSDAGEIDSFDYCYYRSHGLQIDGYSFSDEQTRLNLFVSDYRGDENPVSLTKTEAGQVFRRAENFLTKSLDKQFFQEMEETSQGYGLAQIINSRSKKIRNVKLFLLTDAILSDRVVEIPSKKIGQFSCSYNIWDITRLFRLESSGREREEIEIDLSEFSDKGLQCLPAYLDAGDYESYLVVLPGNILKLLYDRFGQRLLEQNVRTFLQFRGNVNKGMRVTLENEPEMFFAYNNGITATAEQVETERSGTSVVIQKIRNLQIVNGGQTTAAVSLAGDDKKVDLEKVFIQMKLSVIESKRSEEVVPRISEYANTQNRVNAADFFSNHPFHVRIKEHSQRSWAPSPEGAQRETRWFYERARGEYANAQTKLTQVEKRKFKIQNPRPQLFSKTDLAKFHNTWEGLPHIVSLGAQKSFSYFSNSIGKEWEKDSTQFSEHFFRELVGKAILFRVTEKIVSAADWYEGGYRANIVTYSLALLARRISEEKRFYDFESLWRRQQIAEVETVEILRLATNVHKFIVNTPREVANVTEWCKREKCWEEIKTSLNSYKLSEDFRENLITKRRVTEQKNDAAAVQKTDDGINAQIKVMDYCEQKLWGKLKRFGQTKHLISYKEVDLLDLVLKYPPKKIPTELQCKGLLDIKQRYESEGFHT
jgi:hypothetical protein